jgi:hypothetical protein
MEHQAAPVEVAGRKAQRHLRLALVGREHQIKGMLVATA